MDSKIISFNIPIPFPIGPVHSYLIRGDSITLIDSGPKTEKAWKALIYQLNANGYRLKDIDQIILTHHHVDHIGLLSLMKEHHPNIKILAHPLTIPVVEKDPDYLQRKVQYFEELYLRNGLSPSQVESIKRFYHDLEEYADPVNVDQELNDGMKIPGNDHWQVIHSPGHSQGHITLYNSNQEILIAGDHIIGHSSAGAFIEAPFKQAEKHSKSVVEYRNSLLRIRKLKISTVYSGHGEVIYSPYDLIDKELNRFEKRANQLYNLLETGSFSVYELMQMIYHNRSQNHLALYFSEVLGHLELLEDLGKIKKIDTNPIVKYYI